MKKKSNLGFLQGSAWMTFGSVTSNLLGALYVIPWLDWLKPNAAISNTLFSKGYQWYALFLVISQAGIPGAISKQVAKYNSLHQYSTSKKILHNGLIFMAMLGLIFSSIMFLIAPILAAGDVRLIPIFRSLSIAILIIPVMSLLRGFSQGFGDMRPSAISLLIEQIFRIIFILGSTFFVIKIAKGSYLLAVELSTLAAFIGALFSLIYLVITIFKNKNKYHLNVNIHNSHLATTALFLEIIKESIPYIFSDSSITLFFLIDQYTFNQAMRLTGHQYTKNQLDTFFAMFAANANKLTTIVFSLAVSMAVSLTPLLSSLMAKHDLTKIRSQICKIIEIFGFVILPASLGVYAVSTALYTVFYQYSEIGINILKISSIVCITEGLFIILTSIFQALYLNKTSIKYLFVGLYLKIVLQIPLIYLFHEKGAIITTGVALFITCFLMFRELSHVFKLKIKYLKYRLLAMTVFSVLMAIVTTYLVDFIYLFINPRDRLLEIPILFIGTLIGIITYGGLVLWSGLASAIFGQKSINNIKNKIKHFLPI